MFKLTMPTYAYIVYNVINTHSADTVAPLPEHSTGSMTKGLTTKRRTTEHIMTKRQKDTTYNDKTSKETKCIWTKHLK